MLGINKNSRYKNQKTNGEYLPLIPPLKNMSSVSQDIKTNSPVFTSVTPKVELEYSAAQNKYLGLNGTETRTAAYTLFNVGVVTNIKYANAGSIQFHLQVNNLFDRAYQSNLSRLKYLEYYTDSPNSHLGIYNMGRNIAARIIMPF